MVDQPPSPPNRAEGTFFGPVVQIGTADSVTFVGQKAAAVPIKEAIRDPAPIFASVLGWGFTGREWLLAQVDEFLGRSPCGYVWIEADAGMGKSAFAAHLVREHGWFGHFARATRGQTVRAGLQNLAGQLVEHYGMWELAPGRMLPESVFTPEGFETVLAGAADQAQRRGGAVVLVVDGADEAERPEGMLPWGLPRSLPNGVFVVGTYRTGSAPGHSDAPCVVVRIDAADARNEQDLVSHLRKEVQEDVLAARLVEAGMSAEQFTDRVAARCGGVWVYLRYVLHEIRLGLRHAGDVDDLPVDLWSYYTGHLAAWSSDERGQNGALWLLATLAAAGEPLSATTLAVLADVPEEQAREWCQYRLRPFLTATPTSPRRFEIYHASLRELFTERAVSDRLPDDQRVWSETLAKAAPAAHDRIATHYLSAFGGLAEDLPALAADPALARTDDGYPLRYLAGHLQRAGRVDCLHRLLRAERPVAPGRAVNVWFAAHDRADTVDAYLEDIARARQDSQRRTDQALRDHRPATALADEAHYALVASSLTSLTDNVPFNLLSHLVAHGLWTLGRAMAHARRLAKPEHRARALASLAALLPADQRREALDQAVDAATAVTSVHDRTRILTELVGQTDPERRHAVVERALEAVTAIPWALDRVKALSRLGEHVPPERRRAVLTQALEEALAERDNRARVLTRLAGHLPDGLGHPVLERALEEAAATGDAQSHALAMAGLVAHVPAAFRQAAAQQALAEVTAIDWLPDRVQALTELAGHLPEDRRRTVLEQALEVAATIVNGASRTRELARLVRHLPAESQQVALRQAMESAAATESTYDRVEALTELVTHVPAEHRQAAAERALDIATAFTYPDDRVRAVTKLLEYLPAYRRQALAEQVLDAVTAVGRNHLGAWALLRLVGHAPAERLVAVAEQALDAVDAHISFEYTRAHALAELVANVPAEHRQVVAERAWHRAAAIRSEPDRVRAFAQLVDHLVAERRPAALTQALTTATAIARTHSRAWALTELLGHLPVEDRQTVAEQAMELAAELTDQYDRAGMLTRLLGHLPAERRHALAEQTFAGLVDRDTPAIPLVLPEAFDKVLGYKYAMAWPRTAAEGTANTNVDITTMSSRVRTVAELVKHLPDPHRQALLAQALEEATTLDWPADRAWVLTELAARLPEARRPAVLRQALDTVTAAPFVLLQHDAAGALADLVERLPADQRPKVLDIALTMATDVTAITATSNRGRGYGDRTYSGRDRVEALVKLLAHLSGEQRQAVAEQAFDIAVTIPDDYIRSEVIAKLAPCLSAGLFARALAFCPHRRVEALSAWLAAANETISFSTSSDYVHLLRDATRSLPRGDYLSILGKAAPALRYLAGPTVVTAIVGSIDDVTRWWP